MADDMAPPQGGPPPTVTRCARAGVRAGHKSHPDFNELVVDCDDAGMALELHLPNTHTYRIRLDIFAGDRGYIFSESATGIELVGGLAQEAARRLRALGLLT
jgi:hypothetical protein